MNDNFTEIPDRIDKTLTILEQFIRRLENFEREIVPKIGKTSDSVLIPVQILENGYTVLETLFFHISQAFENNLDPVKWHAALLDKMALEIAGTRPRVISDELHAKLKELLRFRHFNRYYFELDYDWRKIELLMIIFREAFPLLRTELGEFREKIVAAMVENATVKTLLPKIA
jgi:hypothetical protein